MQPHILIATTNQGKFDEYTAEFRDLGYIFVSLKDKKLENFVVDEPFDTTEENAIYKAKKFAEKAKMITIADDSAVCVAALGGAPGVHARRFGQTAAERNQKILHALNGFPAAKRQAFFELTGCVYNPFTHNYSVFKGRVDGEITTRLAGKERAGVGYDDIFYYPPLQKTLAELSLEEKNVISHRGKVAAQIKYFLAKQYGFKQIVVPVALMMKNNKMLVMQRRDSRPDFHEKWEFPGGGVNAGESLVQSLQRECKEETGLEIVVEEMLPKVYVITEKKFNYQVFLVPFVCRPKSGTLKLAANEHSTARWCNYAELLQLDFLALNKSLIKENKLFLKKYLS